MANLTQSDLGWIMEQMVGQRSDIPDDQKQPQESLVRGMNQLMDLQPDSRQKVARLAVEAGKPEIARVLLSEARVDVFANEAMQLAEMLDNAGQSKKAIDAYLDAFRDEPRLFQNEHLELIEKQGRLNELAEILTVTRLKKTRGISILTSLLDKLMSEKLCADYGIPFLERLWEARPEVRGLLPNIETWIKKSNRQLNILRARWVPSEFANEPAGWKHLCRVGTDGGWQNWLEPLIENEETLQPLIKEVDEKLQEHEDWYAGKALIGILESKNGNYEPARKWIEENLDKVTSKPKNSDQISHRHAQTICDYLKDRDKQLDQWVTKLRAKATHGD